MITRSTFYLRKFTFRKLSKTASSLLILCFLSLILSNSLNLLSYTNATSTKFDDSILLSGIGTDGFSNLPESESDNNKNPNDSDGKEDCLCCSNTRFFNYNFECSLRSTSLLVDFYSNPFAEILTPPPRIHS